MPAPQSSATIQARRPVLEHVSVFPSRSHGHVLTRLDQKPDGRHIHRERKPRRATRSRPRAPLVEFAVCGVRLHRCRPTTASTNERRVAAAARDALRAASRRQPGRAAQRAHARAHAVRRRARLRVAAGARAARARGRTAALGAGQRARAALRGDRRGRRAGAAERARGAGQRARGEPAGGARGARGAQGCRARGPGGDGGLGRALPVRASRSELRVLEVVI
ncbi:hypothetical protein PsYK624_123530 [Phanerochaete sordida]|uniref:Uncharacterized protein n=1 Tax=Phanerochaete sordida TaxID=48140 RepID=A0A9P3LIA4_9APHY|nr:hypothetical protein PsYK624_123530 [Phanerochaete sordida]